MTRLVEKGVAATAALRVRRIWPIGGQLVLLLLVVLCTGAAATASDHKDGHIGDFYAFVKRGDLVLAMTVATSADHASNPFPDDVTYSFRVDRDSDVKDGDVVSPRSLQEEVVIAVSFKQGRPSLFARGLLMKDGVSSSSILLYTGMRDDPFIRKPVAGKNIAAIVVQLPLDRVVDNKAPLVLWSAVHRGGAKTDNGGHPYRSQDPKFKTLNLTHPSEHVDIPGVKSPDVLVYDPCRAAVYPNGRSLEDDVVDILGLQGKLGNEKPSPTSNDVPFLDRFPYLAPPHDPEHAAFEASAPKAHKGMFRHEMGRFDLGRELRGMGGRDVRLRFWLMAPGGVIRFHKHSQRPAMVYLLSGEVEEYKWGVDGMKIIRAGEATTEAADTEHYWLNPGKDSVTMAAVDLVDSYQEPAEPPAPQPLPRAEWDVTRSEREACERGLKPATVKPLGAIDLGAAFGHIPAAMHYVMRGREIVVKPGEMVPLQRHSGRPSVIYVIEGVILEHRDDRTRPIPLRAGDHRFNTNGVSRWLENQTAAAVRIFEVDFRDVSATPK